MVDINQQLCNLIAYLMKELDKEEIEIPIEVLRVGDKQIIAERVNNNPLDINENVKIKVRSNS